jgi:hypothetical protein
MNDLVKALQRRAAAGPGFAQFKRGRPTLRSESSIADVDEQTMSATFIITTGSADRDGDVVVPSGCHYENYARNPVVFFDHQEEVSIPIGVSEDPGGRCTIQVNDDHVRGTVYFHGETPESNLIFRLVSRKNLHGIWQPQLRTCSIGFMPLEGYPREGERGYVFPEWDLLEWSIVGLPSNPQAALIEASDAERRELQKCGAVFKHFMMPLLDPRPSRSSVGFARAKSFPKLKWKPHIDVDPNITFLEGIGEIVEKHLPLLEHPEVLHLAHTLVGMADVCKLREFGGGGD